jgi:hypothetical protein
MIAEASDGKLTLVGLEEPDRADVSVVSGRHGADGMTEVICETGDAVHWWIVPRQSRSGRLACLLR